MDSSHDQSSNNNDQQWPDNGYNPEDPAEFAPQANSDGEESSGCEATSTSIEQQPDAVMDLSPEWTSVIQCLPDRIFRIDPEGMIHDLKAGADGKTPFTFNDLFESSIPDIPIDTGGVRLKESIRKAGKAQTNVELELSAAGGRRYEFRLVSLPENHVLMVMRDITEKKRKEPVDALGSSFSRDLIEASPISMLVCRSGRIVFINSSGTKLFGAGSLGEILEKHFLDFVPPDQHEEIRGKLEMSARNRSAAFTFETRFIRSDGTAIDAWVAALPHLHEGAPAIQMIICEVSNRDQMRVMETARDAARAESGVYQERLQEAEQAREAAETRSIDLQLKVRNLEEFRESAQGEINILQQRLAESEEVKGVLENEKTTLTEQLQNNVEAREAAETERSNAQERFAELEEAKTAAEDEKSSLMGQLREFEMARDAAKAESITIQERLQETEEAKAAVESEKSSLVVKLKEIEMAQVATKAECRSLQERMAEAAQAQEKAEAERRDMEVKLGEAQEAQEKVEAGRANLEIKLREFEMARDVAKAECMNLQERLKEAEETKDQAETEQLEMEEKLKEAEETNEQAETQQLELEEKLRELEEAKEQAEEENSQWKDKVREAEEALEKAESEGRKQQEELESEKEDFETEKESLEKRVEEAEELKEAAESERQEMEEKLKAAEEAVDTAESEIRELREKLEEMETAAEEAGAKSQDPDAAPYGIVEDAVEGMQDVDVAAEPGPSAASGEMETLTEEIPEVDGDTSNATLILDPRAHVPDPKSADKKNDGNSYDIREVLERVSERIGHVAKEKGLFLKQQVAEDVPVKWEGDPMPLKQILVHLVDNAVKFTENGEITVLAEKDEGEGDLFRLHFSVQDTGIGMSDEKRGAINAFFSEGPDTPDAGFEAVGMGMTMVKKLLAKIGGRLWLEGEENKGTTFHVLVGLKAADASKTVGYRATHETYGMIDLDGPGPQAQERESGQVTPGTSKHNRLLLVEDDLKRQEDLLPFLEGLGTPLDKVSSSNDAYNALKEENYGVIVMAVNLFSLGDVAEMLRVRNEVARDDIPIIAVLDQATNEAKDLLLAMGLKHCLARPFDANQFQSLLSGNLPQEVVGTSTGEPPAQEPTDAGFLEGLTIQNNPYEEIGREPTLQE